MIRIGSGGLLCSVSARFTYPSTRAHWSLWINWPRPATSLGESFVKLLSLSVLLSCLTLCRVREHTTLDCIGVGLYVLCVGPYHVYVLMLLRSRALGLGVRRHRLSFIILVALLDISYPTSSPHLRCKVAVSSCIRAFLINGARS